MIESVRRGLASLLIVGVVVACGRYGEAEVADTPAPAAPDAANDVAVVDAPSSADVNVPDAADACDGPCSCDGDDDGEPAIACGGRDCNDNDKRVRPTADFLPDAPIVTMTDGPGANGDWNCDGKVEKKLPVGLKCTAGIGSCTGSVTNQGAGLEGFADDPPCGGSGTYYKCVVEGLSCVMKAQGSMVQACK